MLSIASNMIRMVMGATALRRLFSRKWGKTESKFAQRFLGMMEILEKRQMPSMTRFFFEPTVCH